MNTARRHRLIRDAGVAAFALTCVAFVPSPAGAQSLKGSRSSLDLQNRIALQHDFTYIRTTAQAKWFADQGYLVRVRSNGDYEIKRMSHPYARPEVALFVSRLGKQYRAACGEKLVVTSLTRPTTRQPGNASRRSVHPTGMAMDLRRSTNRSCRSWLESVLLSLESAGVLEATYERNPPHFHVALFPKQYASYVERRAAAGSAGGGLEYLVRRGDSLWSIAQKHGTSIPELRAANGIRGSEIYPGQVLALPTRR